MTATIIAIGEDLTTACELGLAAARQDRAEARVRWGQVEFVVGAADTLEAAHRAFFAAARAERLRQERVHKPAAAAQ